MGAHRSSPEGQAVSGVDTSVCLGRGIQLRNPVMTASGTCGYGREMAPFLDLNRLGALVVKGISLLRRPGNPPPRIIETCGGMLNAIGLENIGVREFVDRVLPGLEALETAVVVNILGETVEAYVELAGELGEQEGVCALEINVSCPNVKAGGIAFGADPEVFEGLVRRLRKTTRKPLILKLSPNVTDIAEFARRAEGAGADAVSLVNTLRGMSVDAETRRPHLATVIGGLSGPAIKPVALRMVWEASRAVRIPVIGIGGIARASDAIEFILCGASAVQVGSAVFRNPACCVEIIEGIEAYLVRHGVGCVQDLVGALEVDTWQGG